MDELHKKLGDGIIIKKVNNPNSQKVEIFKKHQVYMADKQ